MLPITDLSGNTELLTNFKGFTRKRRVNGEKTIEAIVIPNHVNEHSYKMVATESILEYKEEDYVIKLMEHSSKGAKTEKKVEGVHRFFNDLINSTQYENFTGTMTFEQACQFVFGGTAYSFVIGSGTYSNVTFENFGRKNRLVLFKEILEKYESEFSLSGSTVFLKKEIGVKTDFQYRYRHNVKAINVQDDSHNLATVIRGYAGKPNDDGVYPIEVEYVSPNAGIFGELHAEPVYIEEITSEAILLSHLKKVLVDKPQLSVTIDFLELQAAGYAHDIANEGDYGFIIYEPMDDLMLEARIVEIVELFDANFKPIKTLVTLSNIRDKMTDVVTRLTKTSKALDRLLSGKDKLPMRALEEAVRRSTEMLLNSATELEYTENGIVARSKNNPDHLVLVSSEGVGVSTDNGQSFRNAITGEGIVADLIVVGTMLFDRLKGGELTLGGPDNGNGKMVVLDANGEVIADLDAERGGFSNLYVAHLEAPNVVSYGEDNLNFYVADVAVNDGENPNDSNHGTSWNAPLSTVNEALRRIPLYYNGVANIYLRYGGTHRGDITLRGFVGKGSIYIRGQGRTQTKVVGNISAGSNLLNLYFEQFTINGRSNSYAVVSSYQNAYVDFRQINLHGNNSERGFDILQSGYAQVSECDIQSVDACINARYGATCWARDNTGKGAIRGIYAYGGYFVGGGSAPEGGVSNEHKTMGGEIFPTFTYPYTPPPTPPPAPETTSSWNSTGTYKGDSWRPQYGGQWFTEGYGENAVVQGYWGGFGAYKGLWFFGSNPSNAVSGKTIKSMRLYVQRKSSGGNSGAVTCTFRPHTYTGRPGSEPSYQSPSTTASFKWGEGKWITIPSSFYSGFQNGTSKGIGIWVNSTSTSNYAKFFVDAKLEITYQ
ncbi:phage tail protein [Sutcliffiella horikoshii]|uniref:phage tail protein n=4 Tax=Sutcliffiella horikoshii TaxID=79883 RepID=UPI003CF7D11D